MTKFEQWLTNAPIGGEYVYFEGYNLPEFMRNNPNDRFSDEIRAIRQAYDDGEVILFQQRASPSRFEYIARKPAMKNKVPFHQKFEASDVQYWPEATAKAA